MAVPLNVAARALLAGASARLKRPGVWVGQVLAEDKGGLDCLPCDPRAARWSVKGALWVESPNKGGVLNTEGRWTLASALSRAARACHSLRPRLYSGYGVAHPDEAISRFERDCSDVRAVLDMLGKAIRDLDFPPVGR